MRKVCYNSADFRSNLNSFIKSRCKDFEIDFDPSETVEANFRNLLEGLAKKSPNGKYVLLIDEYDAPISGMLDSDDGRRELVGIRKTLHNFYIQAKAHCGDMRFFDGDGRLEVCEDIHLLGVQQDAKS